MSGDAEWIQVYRQEFVLGSESEFMIPLPLMSPVVAYETIANFNIAQVGHFRHLEYLDAVGWSVIDRYPVYKGKNLLMIAAGMVDSYQLAFVPFDHGSPILAVQLLLWVPPMPLSRSGGGSASVTPLTSSTATATTIAADDELSKDILLANANRKGASIWNQSTGILYLEMGSSVTATDYAVALGSGDYFEVPYGYTGVIRGIWSNDNGFAQVREYV